MKQRDKTDSFNLAAWREKWHYLPQALAMVWSAAPGWTVAWAVLTIIQGVLPPINVYLTKAIVDNLLPVLGSGGDVGQLTTAVSLIILMAGIMLATIALSSIQSWINTAQSELVQDRLSAQIHKQATDLDLIYYETSQFFDQLLRARQDASSQPLSLLRNLGGLVRDSITIVGLIGIILAFGWWIPLILLVSTLPGFLLALGYTRRENEWRVRTAVDRRQANYYELMQTTPIPAGEIRLYQLGPYFSNAYQQIRQRLREENLALKRWGVIIQMLSGFFALIGVGAALGWVFWEAWLGLITIGELTLFYRAFNQGQNQVRSLLGTVGGIYKNLLFLENLFSFLALESEVQSPPNPLPVPTPLQEGITFDKVSFRYPGQEAWVLDRFSIQLPAGKIIAIVGENGAGKSTLIKLLARFFDPLEGRVLADGVDLQEMDPAVWQRQITLMFQNSVQYAATAADNIAYSDWQQEPDREAIEQAAVAAGADEPIMSLPLGYENLLGKWLGGADLSTGEWQRLALARAFLRQASIVVLDEPTSAMDSWAELDWLTRFQTLVAGRTVLIITHRFTTAMYADIIHVMHEGEMVESGSHEALLAANGRYAQSWHAQMERQSQKISLA